MRVAIIEWPGTVMWPISIKFASDEKVVLP
jgi:hypothetical protein